MNEDYLVSKSNFLIGANYNLSLQEQRIILILASKVQINDCEFKEYTFNINEFLKILEISSNNSHALLKKITKGLMRKVFEIEIDNNITLQLAWLCSAWYNKKEGRIILKFSPDLKPFLLKLKSLFTKYKLKNILKFKSKYSIRIYEILKSYEYKNYAIIDLNELKKMVGATANYFNRYNDFKNNVLKIAKTEINKYTDINFDFIEIKEWKTVKQIKFFINSVSMQNSKIFIDENLEDAIIQIRTKFFNLTKTKLSFIKLQELIDNYGLEKINIYLDNYDKFKCDKHNPAGFMIKAIEEEYPIPQEEINNYNQNKPIQSTNYTQREYDDDFFESLYDNFRDNKSEE